MASAGTREHVVVRTQRKALSPLVAYTLTLMLVGGAFVYAVSGKIVLVAFVALASGVSLAVIKASEKIDRRVKDAEPK